MFGNKKAKVSLALIGVIGGGILAGGAVLFYMNGTKGVKDMPINYSFDTKLDVNFKSENDNFSGGIELKNGKIVTQKEGLQQQISVGELNIKGEKDNDKKEIQFSDINLVTDHELGYFGFDVKGDSSDEVYDGLNSKFSKVLRDGKIVKVDNSKAVLEILGDLSKNELVKQLAIGLVTSNPIAYYKQDETYNKLVDYVTSDKLLNFVFKDGDYDETSKKTTIILNEKLCTLSPLISNLAKKMGGLPMIITESECKQSLNQANMMLGFVSIYKEGDTKSGDYKFIINQGNLVDLFIEYKGHKLSKWYVSLVAPENMFSLKLNGDKAGLISSELKVDIDKNGISLKGNIVNGKGEISMKGDIENMFKLDGKINISNYFISKYDIKADGTILFGQKFDLLAKGDLKEGNITFNIGESKLNLDYKGLTYNLDINSENMDLKSTGKKDYLDLLFIGKDYSGEEKEKIEGKYDNGKLTGALYNRGEKFAEITGNYIDKQGKLKINANFKSEKHKIDANFTLEYNYKKGGVKYQIPTNVEEVETNINEIITLPNLEKIGKVGTPTIVLGTTGLATMGTIAFISLQGYSAEAKNSKRRMDLNSITSSIIFKTTGGIPLLSLINKDKRYMGNNIYVGGNKLKAGVNYRAGIPNFEALGINNYDFKDPDGSDYIIAATTLGGESFEILTKNYGEDGYRYMIKGNYVPRKKEKLFLSGVNYGKNTVTLKDIDVNKIKIGDNTNLGIVKRVSPDRRTLTLNDKLLTGTKYIELLHSDSPGLISIDGKIVVDGDKVY